MAERLLNSEANARRIGFVEQCFGNSGQPLAVPHRLLVGEGVLTKMCRKKPKPRQFFLFNDILVYGNIILSKKKYNCQHIMQLENISLQSVPDEGNLRNGWQIISPSKSFTVYAATATEKSEWMSHINKCIQDLMTKHGRKSLAADPSPVWVPDSDAQVCMHCRKSEFSVINRRHHCRKCGIVCCSACASKRWVLPHQSSKPLRVCLTCYYKLCPTTATEPPAYANNESSGEDSSGSDTEPSKNGHFTEEPLEQPTFYEGGRTEPPLTSSE
jgi:hypothetical protein